MRTTEELTTAIRERLTTGDGLDELLVQLVDAIIRLEHALTSTRGAEHDKLRAEASYLHDVVAELTTLGEQRLESLHTEVAAVVRKGSLSRLYGLTPH